MKITREFLESKRACKDPLELFTQIFPDGAEITRENIEIAERSGLGIGSLLNLFPLKPGNQEVYIDLYTKCFREANELDLIYRKDPTEKNLTIAADALRKAQAEYGEKVTKLYVEELLWHTENTPLEQTGIFC